MILWLVLYVTSVFSQGESQVIENYCFNSQSQMKKVKAQLKFILVPVDRIQETQNCFTVITSEYRRELLQQFVKRIDPSVVLDLSSAEIKREPCSLKITKLKSGNQESLQVSLNPQSYQTEKASTDVMTIQTLKEFEISVNQNIVKGECRAINSSRYEIALEIRHDPLPSSPPLPSGAVVELTQGQTPKDQETSQLKTVVQLNRGEKLELGSIFKNLNNQANKIDLQSTSLEMKKSDNAENEKVFLSIE
jgi:hypothetical protein